MQNGTIYSFIKQDKWFCFVIQLIKHLEWRHVVVWLVWEMYFHKIYILHILRIWCSKHNITSSLKCDNILYKKRLFQNELLLVTDAFMTCYQGRCFFSCSSMVKFPGCPGCGFYFCFWFSDDILYVLRN